MLHAVVTFVAFDSDWGCLIGVAGWWFRLLVHIGVSDWSDSGETKWNIVTLSKVIAPNASDPEMEYMRWVFGAGDTIAEAEQGGDEDDGYSLKGVLDEASAGGGDGRPGPADGDGALTMANMREVNKWPMIHDR